VEVAKKKADSKGVKESLKFKSPEKTEEKVAKGVEVKPVIPAPIVRVASRKYLFGRGVKPHWMGPMILWAERKGYTGPMTIDEWKSIFKDY
jgi:hypothetical protein